MKTTLLIVTIGNLVLTSLSLWAVITGKSLLRELRKRLAERSTRSLRQLDVDVTALNSALGSLSSTVKRLASRNGMQQLRESRREVELPNDPKARKAALASGLSRGDLKVVRDPKP